MLDKALLFMELSCTCIGNNTFFFFPLTIKTFYTPIADNNKIEIAVYSFFFDPEGHLLGPPRSEPSGCAGTALTVRYSKEIEAVRCAPAGVTVSTCLDTQQIHVGRFTR